MYMIVMANSYMSGFSCMWWKKLQNYNTKIKQRTGVFFLNLEWQNGLNVCSTVFIIHS
jgi:hypothetical protein